MLALELVQPLVDRGEVAELGQVGRDRLIHGARETARAGELAQGPEPFDATFGPRAVSLLSP